MATPPRETLTNRNTLCGYPQLMQDGHVRPLFRSAPLIRVQRGRIARPLCTRITMLVAVPDILSISALQHLGEIAPLLRFLQSNKEFGWFPCNRIGLRRSMEGPARPAAAPGDAAPGPEEPAPVNQQTKLGEARAAEPAPSKLDNQHNTQAMPVRTRTTAAAVPQGQHTRAPREPRAVPTVAPVAPHGPTVPVQ